MSMIIKLALLSLRFEKLLTVSLTATMMAVIAPLLILFSLRYGIVSTLENNLKSSPVNLEIKLNTGYKLDESFFNLLKNDSRIAFYMPLTRSLSTTVDISARGAIKRDLTALPTGRGDPVVLQSSLEDSLKDTEAYLSETLAEELSLKPGDTFRLVVSRINSGERVNSVVPFVLKGTFKKEYLPYKSILINFNTLICMEDYKDGYEPLIFSDGSKLNESRKYFAKARIYVKTLDDVAAVDAMLNSMNYQTFSHLSSIKELKAITNVLNYIFTVISAISVAGGLFALLGLILTFVLRCEKSYALLLLTGMSRQRVGLMVIFQSMLLSGMAFVFSMALYYMGSYIFNNYFASLLGIDCVVSSLNAIHLLIGFLLTEFISVSVSALIIIARLSKLKIADSLRTV
ncbi:MAG: ABC transporter permease [Succinivibrio sp.]